MQMILDGIMAFTNWLWGIPMLIWVVGGGIVMSVRLGFPQFIKLGFILKNTIGKSFGRKTEEGKISGFKAVTGALASTLGAGNIIGTAMAIAYGGPGGVFWLWLSHHRDELSALDAEVDAVKDFDLVAAEPEAFSYIL